MFEPAFNKIPKRVCDQWTNPGFSKFTAEGLLLIPSISEGSDKTVQICGLV